VAPGSHTWLGGLQIDVDGRTPVAGLFAAGETAGGSAPASWRERSPSACQDVPAAIAISAPLTSAPPLSCDRRDKSTIHGVTPAYVKTSATKRASLLLVFVVAKTATAVSTQSRMPRFAVR
jgi:succinate dehydrogenase/fumarate reductase flavoprotein subunit